MYYLLVSSSFVYANSSFILSLKRTGACAAIPAHLDCWQGDCKRYPRSNKGIQCVVSYIYFWHYKEFNGHIGVRVSASSVLEDYHLGHYSWTNVYGSSKKDFFEEVIQRLIKIKVTSVFNMDSSPKKFQYIVSSTIAVI